MNIYTMTMTAFWTLWIVGLFVFYRAKDQQSWRKWVWYSVGAFMMLVGWKHISVMNAWERKNGYPHLPHRREAMKESMQQLNLPVPSSYNKKEGYDQDR